MKSIDLLRKVNRNLDLLSGSQEYKIKMYGKGITVAFITKVEDLVKELGTQALSDKDATYAQQELATGYMQFISNCHTEAMDELNAKEPEESSNAVVICAWIGIAFLVGLAAIII